MQAPSPSNMNRNMHQVNGLNSLMNDTTNFASNNHTLAPSPSNMNRNMHQVNGLNSLMNDTTNFASNNHTLAPSPSNMNRNMNQVNGLNSLMNDTPNFASNNHMQAPSPSNMNRNMNQVNGFNSLMNDTPNFASNNHMQAPSPSNMNHMNPAHELNNNTTNSASNIPPPCVQLQTIHLQQQMKRQKEKHRKKLARREAKLQRAGVMYRPATKESVQRQAQKNRESSLLRYIKYAFKYMNGPSFTSWLRDFLFRVDEDEETNTFEKELRSVRNKNCE
eukprot:16066_1